MPRDDTLMGLAVQAAGIGMYALDRHGVVVLANAAAGDLLGWSVDDLLGREAHRTFHQQPGDAGNPPEACRVLQVLRGGAGDHTGSDTFWRRDGTPLEVWWVAAAVSPSHADPVPTAATICLFGDASVRPGPDIDGQGRMIAAEQDRDRAEQEARNARLASDAAQTETARLSVLAALSELLNSLDVLSGLDRVAEMVAAGFADACIIDRIDANGRIERVSLAAEGLDVGEAARELHPMPAWTARSVGSLAAVLTGSGADVLVDLDPDHPQPSGDDPLDTAQAALFATLGARRAFVLALPGRGKVLGAMTWVRRAGSSPFDASDLLMARLFALRIGQWMDNLRLNEAQQRAALTLQRSLLTAVPEPDHLEIVARYQPASEGIEVGGDWYDALLSYDGHTVIAIGDVTGHDIVAASRMAQLRNMLRFAALHDALAPDRVLTAVDRAMPALAIRALATALLGCVDRAPGGGHVFRWSNAGHLPPLLVVPGGEVRLLEEYGPDLLLGVDAGTRRHVHEHLVPDGATLVLYTDGLVERRDEDLATGLQRLVATAATLADQTVNDLCDGLLKALTPDGAALDDVALIAVRPHPEDRPRPVEAGPELVP